MRESRVFEGKISMRKRNLRRLQWVVMGIKYDAVLSDGLWVHQTTGDPIVDHDEVISVTVKVMTDIIRHMTMSRLDSATCIAIALRGDNLDVTERLCYASALSIADDIDRSVDIY
jgi:hypothetical protein